MKITIIDPINYPEGEVLEQTRKLLPEWYTEELSWRLLTAVTEENYIAGCIGWTMDKTEAKITWIYVESTFRRLGIGNQLLASMLELFAQSDYMHRTTIRIAEQGGNSLKQFLDHSPWMEVTEYGEMWAFTTEQMRESALIQRMLRQNKDSSVYSLKELEESVIRKNLENICNHGDFQILQPKLWLSDVDQELSIVSIGKNSMMKAGFFIIKEAENRYLIQFIFADEPAELIKVETEAAKRMLALHPDAVLLAEVVNQKAKKVLELSIGKAQILGKTYIGSWNFLAPSFMEE